MTPVEELNFDTKLKILFTVQSHNCHKHDICRYWLSKIDRYKDALKKKRISATYCVAGCAIYQALANMSLGTPTPPIEDVYTTYVLDKELSSYNTNEIDSQHLKVYCKRRGMITRTENVVYYNGTDKYIFDRVLAVGNQASNDGVIFQDNQLIHSLNRFPYPTLIDVLPRINDKVPS